jgi:hypothetical protein
MPLHNFNLRMLAEDLVRVRRPDDRERYAASQRQARIDPNPHQIDAVIFALRRLREGGCILADEVGRRQDHRGRSSHRAEPGRRGAAHPPQPAPLSRRFPPIDQMVGGRWQQLHRPPRCCSIVRSATGVVSRAVLAAPTAFARSALVREAARPRPCRIDRRVGAVQSPAGSGSARRATRVDIFSKNAVSTTPSSLSTYMALIRSYSRLYST